MGEEKCGIQRQVKAAYKDNYFENNTNVTVNENKIFMLWPMGEGYVCSTECCEFGTLSNLKQAV